MLFEKVALSHCTCTAYIPDFPKMDDARRISLVILPGGGYSHVSDREGEPIALTFAAMGMNAVVVNYRVSPAVFPAQMQDAAEAVAYVRRHAEAWHGDPDRIAVCGFSAGGHVAASLGVRWQEMAWWRPLGLTCADVRPNAMILAYPVITAGEFAHRRSFVCLTGTEDASQHQAHSIETLVTAQTPPTFLWHTWTDGSVPAENSLLMAMALHRAGVQGEVHIYPRGGHGASLANRVTVNPGQEERKIVPEAEEWPKLAVRFLTQMLCGEQA